MSGALQGTTTGFKLSLVNFDFPNWAEYINNNFELIDALFRTYITSQGITGVWTVATSYDVNDRTLDDVTGEIYVCNTAHTSPSSGTFLDDRTANPTRWRKLLYDPRNRGTWATGTAYGINDFVVSGNQYAICDADHTSGATFAGDVSGGKWTVLIDLTSALSSATTSASNAASSASAASTSATNAATSATNAASSASAASGSASTASTHASTATTQAGIATTQASNASTSASTASTQATNASNSATAAASSASAAAASAASALAAVPTGKISFFIQTSGISGWVLANGTSIGNGSSGGTQRANADTQALFEAIWNNTTNSECQLQDSAGSNISRGASAAADYAANRRIVLPDMRGEFFRGLDLSRGVDSGRVNLSRQDQQLANHAHRFTINVEDGPSSGGNRVKNVSTNSDPTNIDTQNPLASSLPASTTAGNENRPRNVAMSVWIKL